MKAFLAALVVYLVLVVVTGVGLSPELSVTATEAFSVDSARVEPSAADNLVDWSDYR